jgi:monoamine oxidase
MIQGDAVVSITQEDESKMNERPCMIRTQSGRQWSCSYVVVAMAPTIAGRLTYSPRLPTSREQLLDKSFMGCIIKVIVIYDKPYWRLNGYSGEVVCDCSKGPVFNVFDQCKTDSKVPTTPGCLALMDDLLNKSDG